MPPRSYADFLPSTYTTDPVQPTSTWWPWRGGNVHVARSAVPSAPVRVLVVHGGGGYSGALWPLATAMAGDDVDLIAPDLPLYGDTTVSDPAAVRYDDWVDLLCELVRAERSSDQRPLVLFGASMGGMLAYEVAARERSIAAVVATCLLDVSDPRARAAASRFSWMGRPAPPLLRVVDPVLGRIRLPIRWMADMAHMSSDPELSTLCATDPRGGGVAVPIGFVSSWMNFQHTAPETFDAAPVTLVAPGADEWTPPDLSLRFLQRIQGPTKVVTLQNCGHFPIEEPGLTRLRDELRATLSAVARPAP